MVQPLRIFCKRHPGTSLVVGFSNELRVRILRAVINAFPEPGYVAVGTGRDYLHALTDELFDEHGWEAFPAWHLPHKRVEQVYDLPEFFKRGDFCHIFDALEILFRLLEGYHERRGGAFAAVINRILEEEKADWRMLAGLMIRVDSAFLREHVAKPALELLKEQSFTGPQEEYQTALEALSTGNRKALLPANHLP